MYESFYQLRQTPFRRTPDPYLFYGRSIHNHGLATLRDAVQQGEGFMVITGGPGTGKTELILTLIEEQSPPQPIFNIARIVPVCEVGNLYDFVSAVSNNLRSNDRGQF